jgi:hypothetical protein
MAATLKVKRTPITTPPYRVPSADITPDPPIFSLVTTFNLSLSQIQIFDHLWLRMHNFAQSCFVVDSAFYTFVSTFYFGVSHVLFV